jgi:soluble lytic murein transglycosylase-like protein
MKKLTVLAAAFAAGLTSFAANSAPHPSKSLRVEDSETAPVAKTQDKATAKSEKQEQATTKSDKSRQNKAVARQAAEKSQTKTKRVAEKRAPVKKQAAEKSEPNKKRVAEKAEPRRKRVATKSSSKTKHTAEKKTPKAKQTAKKSTPKVIKAVEKITPKAEKFAEKSTSKPKDGGDRQVAVKEPMALDLVETASIGSKGAKTVKGTGGRYSAIIAQYAASYGVPVSLAHAVIQVESNYRPNARGSAGEIGLMQIKPSTARMMGYEGSTQGLFHPETNIKFGMKYLAKAQKLGGGTTCGTILKYNAGHAAKRMNPVSSAYCVKIKRFLGV